MLRCTLALFLLAQAALWSQTPAKNRTVVVISLDGFPASALEDPRTPVPTIRRLIREGAFAARMTTYYPTVTWPAHTTMITGVAPAKHGVLYNGIFVKQGTTPPKVEPWRPQTEMVKAPTVYEAAFKAGLTTAEVDWVAIFESPFITWRFAELPNPDGAIEKEMVAAGIVARDDIADFRRTTVTFRDHVWTEAAAHILRTHKPNLLLFHPLNLDSTNHRYGPGSLASASALEYADKMVARLVDTAREAGMLDRTTFLVLADHGFRVVRKNIRLNALFKSQGLITTANDAVKCDVWAVPEGGSAMVYINDPKRRAELLPKLKQMFAGIEGVQGVYDSADFPKLGLPVPEKYEQMADILVAAKPGYGFAGGNDGAVVSDVPAGQTPGSHGYLASDSAMDVFLVAWGPGVKAGKRIEGARNVDVAATIAELLGVKMPGIEGKPLPLK